MKALQETGIDVRARAREGRYTMVDAEEMLNSFMVDGTPNLELFNGSVGHMLINARKAAQSREHGLTVFGEMVAVLWDRGNKEGALQLEALWNDTLQDRTFHLHCAYPRGGFVNRSDEMAVCNTHSHVVH